MFAQSPAEATSQGSSYQSAGAAASESDRHYAFLEEGRGAHAGEATGSPQLAAARDTRASDVHLEYIDAEESDTRSRESVKRQEEREDQALVYHQYHEVLFCPRVNVPPVRVHPRC